MRVKIEGGGGEDVVGWRTLEEEHHCRVFKDLPRPHECLMTGIRHTSDLGVAGK